MTKLTDVDAFALIAAVRRSAQSHPILDLCDLAETTLRELQRLRQAVSTPERLLDDLEPVTKSVTKLPDVTKRRGRPAAGDRAMTAAERKRRSRARV